VRPTCVDVLLGLAECFHDLADLDEATRLVDAVLETDPHSVPGLIARGQLAFRRGQFARGEQALRPAAELAPFEPEVYLFLSFCLRSQGKVEEAALYFNRYRKLSEERAHVRELMLRLIDEGRLEAAIPYQIAMILMRNGQVEEGVRWLRAALRLDPGFQPALSALREHSGSVGEPGRAASLQP
jgi:tetratricopeptide (TPR) repeat protein